MQEGYVKNFTILTPSVAESGDKINIILQTESQVTKIAQSLTGNLLSISTVNKNQQKSFVYQEIDEG